MDLEQFKDSDPVALAAEIAKAEGARERAQVKAKKESKRSADLQREVDSLRAELSSMNVVSHFGDVGVPAWLKPKARKGKHRATPFLMLSDLHLDEVVDLEEMDYQNAYNREIAEMRFKRVIDKTIEISGDYVAGVEFDGIVCALGGDIITGIIHEELAESNEATVPETLMYWAPIIAAGIKRLADHFGKVFVPCVDGNHDRTYAKIRMKKRAVSSNAWIMYNTIGMLLRDDDRITMQISKSPEILFDVYDTTFLLDHGDKFRGGGGVGGIYPPMLKWVHRKLGMKGREFDIAVIGHWHQLIYHSNIFVNGSLKGYDEYARNSAFGFERPQQLLFYVTPEHGVTFRTQVFADHKSEGWQS